MRVTILGAHNMESPSTRHTCFLVDDAMAIDAGSLMTTLAPSSLERLSAVLLTHRHYDHIRDLPSLGLATMDNGRTVDVYGLADTLDALRDKLMDGRLYPDFTRRPSPERPKFRLRTIAPDEEARIGDYRVRAIAAPHGAPAVGYVIKGEGDEAAAFTGDIGGGLLPFFTDAWRPRTLFVEVTFPDSEIERARHSGHLAPQLMAQEIRQAQAANTPLPRIVVVHRDVSRDGAIMSELATLAAETGVDIAAGQAGDAFQFA